MLQSGLPGTQGIVGNYQPPSVTHRQPAARRQCFLLLAHFIPQKNETDRLYRPDTFCFLHERTQAPGCRPKSPVSCVMAAQTWCLLMEALDEWPRTRLHPGRGDYKAKTNRWNSIKMYCVRNWSTYLWEICVNLMVTVCSIKNCQLWVLCFLSINQWINNTDFFHDGWTLVRFNCTTYKTKNH